MRRCVGFAVAALVAAGCGGGGTGIDGAVTQRTKDVGTGGDLTCAKCIVTGGAPGVPRGIGWELSAIPVSGPDAGPGFGGNGIAATGFVRLIQPELDGPVPGYDFAVDTILGCTRSPDGSVRAFVSGSPGPNAADRFFLLVSDEVPGAEPASLAFFVGPADGSPPGEGSGPLLILPVSAEALHVDKLDRCEFACPVGECVCPDTGACEPCHASSPEASQPPDVTPPVGDPVTPPAPGDTAPPAPGGTPPPPGPFIPL